MAGNKDMLILEQMFRIFWKHSDVDLMFIYSLHNCMERIDGTIKEREILFKAWSKNF
jgi:hypothetical protein